MLAPPRYFALGHHTAKDQQLNWRSVPFPPKFVCGTRLCTLTWYRIVGLFNCLRTLVATTMAMPNNASGIYKAGGRVLNTTFSLLHRPRRLTAGCLLLSLVLLHSAA